MVRAKSLNVILYGMGVNFDKSIGYICDRFDVTGCSDRDETKSYKAHNYEMKYINPYDIKNYDFDYILLTAASDEIKQELMEITRTGGEKILTISQWQKMDFLGSYGEKNPDKTFYYMSKPIRRFNGIISLLYMYLDLLSNIEGMNYIPVIDLQTYSNQYLEDSEVGIVNAWEKFFEQLSSYTVNEVLDSKNVILAHDDAGYLEGFFDNYEVPKLSEMFHKYIRFTPMVQNLIKQEMERTIAGKENILGVLYRGTDMVSLKLKNHIIQPSLEELYEEAIDVMKKRGSEYIFLSTEDERALQYFKERFGEKLLYTEQLRHGNLGSKWIADIKNARKNDAFLRGAEYITTVYILSKCNHLVAGLVAGSVGALVMNDGKYETIRIIDKGCYD